MLPRRRSVRLSRRADLGDGGPGYPIEPRTTRRLVGLSVAVQVDCFRNSADGILDPTRIKLGDHRPSQLSRFTGHTGSNARTNVPDQPLEHGGDHSNATRLRQPIPWRPGYLGRSTTLYIMSMPVDIPNTRERRSDRRQAPSPVSQRSETSRLREVGGGTPCDYIVSPPRTRTRPMIRTYTDDELNDLGQLPKRVTNPGAGWSEKPGVHPVHRQRTFRATGTTEDDQQLRFLIYQRQSLRDQHTTPAGSSTAHRVECGSRSPDTTGRATSTEISGTNHTSIGRPRPRSPTERSRSMRPKKPRATKPSRVLLRV